MRKTLRKTSRKESMHGMSVNDSDGRYVMLRSFVNNSNYLLISYSHDMMNAVHMRPRAPAKLSLPAGATRQMSGRFVVKAAKVADGPKVAIVGVTGAVGQEFLRVRWCRV